MGVGDAYDFTSLHVETGINSCITHNCVPSSSSLKSYDSTSGVAIAPNSRSSCCVGTVPAKAYEVLCGKEMATDLIVKYYHKLNICKTIL